ncbi:hypothetical protein BU23DRAFT_563829 [Bimuria novae-zelandiae CBS 107.79]|uniref:CFEM domain-containing protein n=1 Tax=Bimuria novae-zelandiae CBS 107.79 TaxID=1447943 RepID=A0A6A5VMM6_9PLEO|nr:hypothetical protein BU23DRAFT_563829 [Bimuria novae-zelandiae CBS 107.79]
MKYTFTLAALAALSAAQSIADLPTCSLSCVVEGVSGIGCSATDFACSCSKAAELTPAITPCVQGACADAADQAKVISVLEGICASAGFPINVPAPTAPEGTPAPTETEVVSSSVAHTIQTSVPASSLTDIGITATGYPLPTSTAEDTCVVVTVTVTEASSSVVAPYPTGPAGTGVSPRPTLPVGTGVSPLPAGTSSYSAPPSYFTGAASAMKVPAGVAGVLGLAAFVL